MSRISTSVTVRVPRDQVWEYLRNRYDTHAVRKTTKAIKGYDHQIQVMDELKGHAVTFYTAGREPLLQIPVGGWRWGYELEELEPHLTEVTIWYEWGLFMSFLSMFTVHHQAANELVETVMALEALAVTPGAMTCEKQLV